MFQLIIVITILLIALSYGAWRIRMVIKNAGGRCYGCPLKYKNKKKHVKKFLKDKKCGEDRQSDDRPKERTGKYSASKDSKEKGIREIKKGIKER